MPKKKPLAPQQARSRASLKRLLKATIEVLEEKGLEGATIPRIAARAGLSPGAVYRRFPDKDALLRTVMLETWERIDASTAALFTPELAKKSSLKFFAEHIVRSNLMGFRRHTGMLRALILFYITHPSEAFRRKVDEVEARTMRRVVDFLMHYRAEIRHPDPEMALSFSIMLITCTLRDLIVMNFVTDVWAPLLPKGDDQLVRELSRAMLNYLGVESKN